MTATTAATCRTVDDAFNAGWADGADDLPLTRQEIETLVVLHAPHLKIGGES